MFVGDGAHDGAHGETVEVVVNKDEQSQPAGGQHGAGALFDFAGRPVAVGAGAAGHGDHADQGPQQGEEDHHVGVVANFGGDE